MFVYCLYLVTFLLFPILAYLAAERFDFKKHGKLWKIATIFFLFYNLLLLLGVSFSGDYLDYSVCSLEYFYFALTTFLFFRIRTFGAKAIRIFGSILLGIGFVQGVFGILLFLVIAQDYEADEVFESHPNHETRRYKFGFATLENTKYTFESYTKFGPMEYRIDVTTFMSSKTKLNFSDEKLKVRLNENTSEITFITDSATVVKKIR